MTSSVYEAEQKTLKCDKYWSSFINQWYFGLFGLILAQLAKIKGNFQAAHTLA